MKKLLFPFFIIGTVIMMMVMGSTGKPLKTATTPNGIVNLELAYNTTKINAVFKAWQINTTTSKIPAAKTNTYWDFLFIFFYAGLLYLCCRKFYEKYKHAGFFYNTGGLLAKAVLVAAALDVIENMYLLKLLDGNITNAFATACSACAMVKFTLLIMAVVYILISLAKLAFTKRLSEAGV